MNDKLDFPVQIDFQQMLPSEAVQTYIYAKLKKLSHYYHRLMSCHVLVEIINRHHRQGKLFHVCLDLKIPQASIVVSRCTAENHAHEDVFVCLRDAFKALQRKLQCHEQKRHGKKKHHDVTPQGHVVKILHEGNHGFIETYDGRSVYFTSNSVVNGDFKKLSIGDAVRYVEASNETGKTSASTVRRIGKHHLVA